MTCLLQEKKEPTFYLPHTNFMRQLVRDSWIRFHRDWFAPHEVPKFLIDPPDESCENTMARRLTVDAFTQTANAFEEAVNAVYGDSYDEWKPLIDRMMTQCANMESVFEEPIATSEEKPPPRTKETMTDEESEGRFADAVKYAGYVLLTVFCHTHRLMPVFHMDWLNTLTPPSDSAETPMVVSRSSEHRDEP